LLLLVVVVLLSKQLLLVLLVLQRDQLLMLEQLLLLLLLIMGRCDRRGRGLTRVAGMVLAHACSRSVVTTRCGLARLAAREMSRSLCALLLLLHGCSVRLEGSGVRGGGSGLIALRDTASRVDAAKCYE
jgi:hypothetical protein